MHRMRLPLALCLLALSSFVFTSQVRAEEPAKSATAPTSKIYTSAESAEFIALAKSALAAMSTGKSAVVIAKLTDLESSWDDKEKTLRPRDEARWVIIDKTMDKAIAALRGSKVDNVKGKEALEAVLKLLVESTK